MFDIFEDPTEIKESWILAMDALPTRQLSSSFATADVEIFFVWNTCRDENVPSQQIDFAVCHNYVCCSSVRT